MAGYKGFGSFHSDNVEEMIRLPAEAWTAPTVPETVATTIEAELVGGGGGTVACGSAAMAAQFHLDLASWTFVNHGAFGATCRVALQTAQAWQVHCERQPLRFIDRELFPHIVHSLRCIAAEVGVPPERCVFLPNATTGFNAALRSAPLAPGDTVFLLDIAYGSMKKAVAEIAGAAGATVVTMPVVFPLSSEDDLVAQVAAAMPPTGVKLAVFDHVASNTGLVLPVGKLAALAASRGAWVLIDGAHGLQSAALDIDKEWPHVDWCVSRRVCAVATDIDPLLLLPGSRERTKTTAGTTRRLRFLHISRRARHRAPSDSLDMKCRSCPPVPLPQVRVQLSQVAVRYQGGRHHDRFPTCQLHHPPRRHLARPPLRLHV